MRNTRLARLLAAAAAMLMVACGGPSPVSPSPSPSAFSEPPAVPTVTPGRIVIISVDGLRPDAIMVAGAGNIQALANRGAYSWQAQTIQPSNTLPSHISMLSGYTPDVHGVTWDEYEPARGQIRVPTLFGLAKAKGLRTALVAGKEKFTTFRDTNACDTWLLSVLGDDGVAGQATATSFGRPDLVFVHLPDVDLAGHALKWMSEPYLAAVRRADQAVGRIVASLPADTTIILTADHGGRPDGHGTADRTDTTIPWIIAGPAIVKGRQLASVVSTVDTAATAAFVLGLELRPDATGRPVYEAFQTN